ncbi:MAG: hypothetical protein HZC51_10170, partial [Nitrospirae bacterium]|nr:hypothetical protein [Nitrospirota bacterium]
MERLRITPIVLAVLLAYARFACAAAPPHTDYRTGYTAGCTGGAACHTVTGGTFTPGTLDRTAAPNEKDYTDFCVTCHNVAGEAHDKSAGTPSTNLYDNKTSFIPGNYQGSSHNWKGLSGNAGTRTPANAAMTSYVDNGKVGCQTCHDAMDKAAGIQNMDSATGWLAGVDQGDHRNYRISGYTTTSQYLAQYIKVYRTSSSTSRPTNTRTKKQYLVKPSEYTYDYATAIVTFSVAQKPAHYIYVDIPQPYLRADNTANALCLDCHNNRTDDRVSHPGDAASKDNHPVGVSYGKAYGSHTTLRSVGEVSLYREGGLVVCTTCHDPHNAPGNNGSILREKTQTELCAACHDKTKVGLHGGKKHPKYANNSAIPTGCTECHTAHDTKNLYLVRDKVLTPSGTVKRVGFQRFTGINSFGDDSGFGICEVCHTQTKYHKAETPGGGHNARKNCLQCHKHETGFSPSGGGAPCYGCHDGSGAPDIKSLMGLGSGFAEGGKPSRHIVAFDNQSSSSCLAMCHKGDHDAESANLKTTPETALCYTATCHDGGSGLTSAGRPIDLGPRFGTSLHNYTATVADEFGLFSYSGNCTKCHLPHGSDSYPNVRNTINGRQTNGNSEDLCFGCHDSGRAEGAADIESLWKANTLNRGHYDYANGKQLNCVVCHGPHGTGNDRMIKDSLGGPGLSRDAICRACHEGGAGSVYDVMSNSPGSYGPDFSAGSVHEFGLGVAIGGHSVDLTCTGCHDPHNTENARLLQDKIVFSGYSVVTVGTVSAVVSPQGGVTSYTGGWKDYCAVCHTSMLDTGGQSPYRRHPVGIGPGQFYQYTAAFGMPAAPLESGDISCVSCHYTHGSPKHSLLRFENITTPENHLCLQCHENDKFMQGGYGSHGGFLQNQGRCSDCHNMHTKANRKLLQQSTESVLCLKCHSGTAWNGFYGWTSTPSMFNVWTTTANMLSFEGTGGTFGRYSELRGGNAHSMHDINDEATPAPGGVTTEHRCGTCHNPHGSRNFRVLRTAVNNVTGITVYARTDESGRFVNYSTGFVKFCTACHTTYSQTDDGNGNWIRHPVNVLLGNFSTESYNFDNNTSYTPKVQLETGENVTCVSCHFAHGSPQDANLKFPDGRWVNLCKTCHNRDTFSAGSPGSHAGFTGNDGTCSDCHSMHSDGNAKLLKSDAETALCVNCHDNPGTSASPNPSHFDVWKGNVFDAPTSWFGTAGSFGTYDPADGGTAFSMHPVNSDARVAPGGSATVAHCGTCHDTHGSGNYRLLKKRLGDKTDITVTATVDEQGRTQSYGSGMSDFCTACHKSYIQYGTSAGYTRHPVDVSLTAQELTNYNHFQGEKYLPLEAGNKVTCTTCHFAHGSPYEKMKRMPGNQMCQVCHAKGLDPLAAYADVQYTHGGFSGSGGDCSGCHSMHDKNNRKLLKAADEKTLCYGCHGPDGTALRVWRGDTPSTPDEWDGTGGSFGSHSSITGGTIQSHHNIDGMDEVAPGGGTVRKLCGTCHNPHGNNNYRLLRDDVNGQ